jgi:hypothetical protein
MARKPGGRSHPWSKRTRPWRALLFGLCAIAVVLLAVSLDLLKQNVMRLAQGANQESPAVGYSLAE